MYILLSKNIKILHAILHMNNNKINEYETFYYSCNYIIISYSTKNLFLYKVKLFKILLIKIVEIVVNKFTGKKG